MRPSIQTLILSALLVSQLVMTHSTSANDTADQEPALEAIFTFTEIDQLKNASAHQIALQLGQSGGLWVKQSGKASSNGGTLFSIDASTHWARQCDPGRLDARWFGVVADGVTDDASALQAAIDALPPSGGKVLLPSGRMLCKRSLRISRSFITLEGVNCGLLSKHFEAGRQIGQGSLLLFEGCDGVVIQPPATPQDSKQNPPRLGGITLRDLGIAGTDKQDGQTGILVKRGENRPWGSTDGLLLERVYTIDLTWAAKLNDADMTVITHCWLSECGNGLKLRNTVYNLIANTCFADNDGIGVSLQGGKGNELSGNVFVRNKQGLILKRTERTRVIGGTFESDPWGGPREDQAFILSHDCTDTLINGVTFNSEKQGIQTAIQYQGTAPVHSGCSLNGELEFFISEISD